MSSLNLGQLSIGLGIGYSSILIPQLNAETSQVSVTSTKIEIGISETSWIVSLVSIGQIVGAILGAFLASAIGRKGEGYFTFHHILSNPTQQVQHCFQYCQASLAGVFWQSLKMLTCCMQAGSLQIFFI